MRICAIALAGVLLTGCGGGGGSSTPTPTPTPTPTQSNSAPTLAQANGNQATQVGQAFDFDPVQGTFSDPDGDTLSYTITLSDPANGLAVTNNRITGTPNTSGTVTVTVTASDPGGLQVSDSFTITIGNMTMSGVNILFIIADDMGQDSSAQYMLSTDQPITPELDVLAANGLVFDNLWVNPVCSPTRGTMLSGKYGLRTNILTPGDAFPAAETLLHRRIADTPESAQYATAMIGKWHLGGGRTGPNDAGLDHFAGILGGGVADYFSWTLNVNGTNSQVTSYATTEITDQAISWVQGQTSPWFMWVAYNAPHTPFHLPPANLHTRNLSGTAADINANPRPYYLAAIEAMDAEIGRLLDALPAAVRANTLVIFVGDNGTPQQVRDNAVFPQGAKGSVYEGGVRVPLIISGAGVTRVGEREDALLNGVDFYTTIAELAGQTLPSINDSRSFAGLLNGTSAAPRSVIYSELTNSQAIRNARYKLIEPQNGAREFYDLMLDPTESSNLIGSSTDISTPLAELESALAAIEAGTN